MGLGALFIMLIVISTVTVTGDGSTALPLGQEIMSAAI